MQSKKYVSSPANIEEKTDKDSEEDNFVTIFLKPTSQRARNNIIEINSWLYELLETNKSTVDMVDITKYLLYKATGRDFGVTEFDFSIYDPASFKPMTDGIYGNTVQEKVWFTLRANGYSEIATAAVMGNIEAESGFDSELIEAGNGIGFGLCQWSYGRREAYESYASSKGVSAGDINTQIEFLVAELSIGGGANGYASCQLVGSSSTQYDGKSYTRSDWENATDLDTATIAFMALFERPSYDSSINHISRRREAAKKYYNEFQGKNITAADSRIGPITLSGDNATKMAAMLTDACRIADDDSYTYVYGAGRPADESTRTFDCSSFVAYMYKKYFNIDLIAQTESMYSQAASGGNIVSMDNLQPGDVLYHSGHVAIYIGNGQDVEAMSTARGIVVTTYNPSRFTHAFRFVR